CISEPVERPLERREGESSGDSELLVARKTTARRAEVREAADGAIRGDVGGGGIGIIEESEGNLGEVGTATGYDLHEKTPVACYVGLLPRRDTEAGDSRS